MKALRVTSVLLLAQPWLVQAAAPTYPVDPAVNTVRSGGYWETNRHRGRYRVVIAQHGFEHIQSFIRIDWVLDTTPSDSAKIEKYVVLQTSLLGSVDVESMRSDRSQTVVVLSGPLQNGSLYHCTLTLGTDGSFNKSSGC
jgi:hypothetical protein